MYSRRPKTLEELERENRRQNAVALVVVLVGLLAAMVAIGLIEAMLGMPHSRGVLPWAP